MLCFCDASATAYAAMVYLQIQDSNGKLSTHLGFSKSRVSPTKAATIPRLELLAVLIGVRAVRFVQKQLAFEGDIILWSDSMCVLHWLKSKKPQGTFVKNRIEEVRKKSEGIEVRYIKSSDNPADLASREKSVKDISSTWWHGPAWINLPQEQWPVWAIPLPGEISDKKTPAEGMSEACNDPADTCSCLGLTGNAVNPDAIQTGIMQKEYQVESSAIQKKLTEPEVDEVRNPIEVTKEFGDSSTTGSAVCLSSTEVAGDAASSKDLKNGKETSEEVTLHEEVTVDRGNDRKSPFGIDPEGYSSLQRLVRVTAWCNRFIDKIRKKKAPSYRCFMQPEELRRAMRMWIIYIQQSEYSNLRECLQKRKSHPLHNQLGVKIDDDDLIRCYGRLAKANLPAESKFPVLLPKKCHFTRLVIMQCHERNMHVGVTQTLAQLRLSYWIPHGRRTVSQCLLRCQPCRKSEGPPFALPKMPELPTGRVTINDPFSHTGLDYFGPLHVKTKDHSTKKVWTCIFTCLTTRAVHLEVAEDMSADAFFRAFRRFVSRRNLPEMMICDNAPQFKALARLTTEGKIAPINVGVIQAAIEKMKWWFITEYSPWAGGFYERMVQVVKRVLRKVLGTAKLTSDQLSTMLCEIELIVNSRPLTHVDSEVETTVLTPNHFLKVKPFSAVLDCGSADDKDSEYLPQSLSTKQKLLQTWKKGKIYIEEIWRIWSNEYLLALREQLHWMHKAPKGARKDPPKVGEVVLLKKDGRARSRWRIARVHRVKISEDGQVRSVQVKLPSGALLWRPISLLYPLEVGESQQDVVSTKSSSTQVTRSMEDSKSSEKQVYTRAKRKSAIEASRRIQSLYEETESEEE